MKRTKLWGILLLCVLLALPVFGLAGEGQATELVVGTFNVDVKAPEQLVTEQRDLLAAKNVEIFGIQEVDRLLPRYEQETYDPLEDFTQGAYVDSFFGMSIAKGTGGGGYGNAIVSAFPLSDPTVTELYGAAQAPQELQEQIYAVYGMWGTGDPAFGEAMMGLWGEGGAMSQGGIEPRSYSRAVFEKDGKQIAFYCTHLTVESPEVRAEQLKEIKAALDSDPVEYKIAVGDFNADQGTHEYDLFLDGYRIANGLDGVWHNTIAEDEAAREGLELETVTSYVDNIIVSENITIQSVEMIETGLSDHNPLVATLLLQ